MVKPNVHRIRNWSGCFEVAQNKACKAWSWIAVPIKHDGKSFRRLMALPNGPAIYGAWILIAAVAAKCEPRGTLLDDGVPLTAEDLHFKTGAPEALFAEALDALTSERIGWLELIELEHAQATLEQTEAALELPDRTGQNRTEQLPVPVSGAFSKPNEPQGAKTAGKSAANGKANTSSKNSKGAFRKVTKADLGDDATLLSWFEYATTSAASPVLAPSEANLLNVFAAAERALEVGNNPAALFASIVGAANWKVISQPQEDRARKRLARLKREVSE